MTTNILNSEDRVLKTLEPMEDKLLKYEEFVEESGKVNIGMLINHLRKEGRLHPLALIKILMRVQDILKMENNMIEITGETAIFGDLHGQFYDLINIYQDFEKSDENLLFLGDYVDRGCFGTEVCILLFCLKLNNPGRVNLLRGNHECRIMTKYFNFRQECLWKYNSIVYDHFMDTFDCLPLCCLIHSPLGKFFCVHGGISPELHTLSDIAFIDRFHEPDEDGLMCDLLWSDPLDDSDYDFYTDKEQASFQKEMFKFNSVRGCSFFYGFGAVKKFLAKNDIVCLVRAHEVQENGCKMNFQCCTQSPVAITIFTAPNYCDCYDNDAAVLMIENEELSFLSYSHVAHPFWLPKFTNAVTFTLPLLFQEMNNIASDLLSSVIYESIESSEVENKAETPELPSSKTEIILGNTLINIDDDYIGDSCSEKKEQGEEKKQEETTENTEGKEGPLSTSEVQNITPPIECTDEKKAEELKLTSKFFQPFNTQNRIANTVQRRRSFAGNSLISSMGHDVSVTMTPPTRPSKSRLSALEVRAMKRTSTIEIRGDYQEGAQKVAFSMVPSSRFEIAKKNDLRNEYRPVDTKELKEYWKQLQHKTDDTVAKESK